MNEATAIGRSLPISTKHSIEVCDMIRGKKLSTAKQLLSKVLDMKIAVPLRRFNQEVAHKHNTGPGRYPLTCCKQILSLLESAEATAQYKGMATGNLIISRIAADKGPKTPHYGRLGRNAKRTHVQVVLGEA